MMRWGILVLLRISEDLDHYFWVRILVCLGDEDSTRRPATHAACACERYSPVTCRKGGFSYMRNRVSCDAHAPGDASFLSLHRQDLAGVLHWLRASYASKGAML